MSKDNPKLFYPLSHGQQALWFLYQRAPESLAYNIFMALRITSEIDFEALHRAWQKIYDRHPIIRTTYTTYNGQPVQQIYEKQEVNIQVIDASNWSEDNLKKQILIEADRPFNLEQGPVQRLTLFTCKPAEHILLVTMHHIAADMWSYDVMLTEMLALYANETDDSLPQSMPYTEYVRWQSEMLLTSEGERLWEYWQQQLAGKAAILNLPIDKPRPTVQTYNGASQTFHLNEQLIANLKSLAQGQGVTPYTILLSAFQVLLYRYSGQEEILIGTPLAGRIGNGFKQSVGYFVNLVVLQANFNSIPTFEELLAQNRSQLFKALKRQSYPFPLIVKNLQIQRDRSYSPLFQVSFTSQKHRWYESNSKSSPTSGKKLQMEPYQIGHQRGSAFDLDLMLMEAGETLELCWQYNTDLFDAATIMRMIGNFQTLLEGIIANPAQRISDLPILTEAERHQILVEWNNTDTDYSVDQCIHQLFEEQVEKTPDAIAVKFANQHLTYHELNCRANQLARYLQKLGVGPEVKVGICVERSLETVIGLLGILKAGGAYVPIDPSYPQSRQAFIVKDAQIRVLLTQQDVVTKLPEHQAQVICLDSDWTTISQECTKNPDIRNLTPDNLAYIIYTSGSTGQPKGVLIPHANVVRLLQATQSWFHFNEHDVWTLFHSYAFDFSVWELWGALCYGGRVVIVSYLVSRTPQVFCDLLCQEQVTILNQTPSAFRQLMQQEELSGKTFAYNLRLVIFGGEALDIQSLAPWFERHGDDSPQLVNMYGITETTVHVTYRPLTVADLKTTSGSVIGRPIPDLQVYILDKHNSLLPIGVSGEICVGGAGLARGYLNRPELTNQKFIPNPYSNKPGDRLYKSGDLARFLSDGNIEYLGRIDNQVKIRGFRIELGEIEAVLNQHPQVLNAVVIAWEDQLNKRLIAYIVPQKQQVPSNSMLREFLKENLPDYMVPSAFVVLDAIPLTPNGKLDRRHLPIPATSNNSDSFVAPRTATEEILAKIWQEVLHLEQVGIHDNFFELGGDSIISIQIIARANQHGLEITTKQLFKYQTIAELASVAGMTSSSQAEQGLVIGEVPLTPIQHWFFDQNWQQPHYFNNSVLLQVPSDIKPAFLEQAVKHLMAHHDGLRMRFVQQESAWQQWNSDDYDFVPFQVINLSAVTPAEQVTAIESTSAELQETLNLATGPILRVVLFQLGAANARLLFIIHHLVIDRVSLGILFEDLTRAYCQLTQGEAIQLPPKTTSFKDWAIRQRDYGQSKILQQELELWLAQSSPDIKPLPVDYTIEKGANTQASTEVISVSLTADETRALFQEVPAVYNTQLNDLLLTALVQAFAQWTGSPSLLIEIESHGREALFEDVDLSRTVGWFTTISPALLDLRGVSHPGEALKTIKEQLRGFPHNGIGYGILRYLSPNADIPQQLQALPTAQVCFDYMGNLEKTRLEPILLGLAPESSGRMFSPKAERIYLLDVLGIVIEDQLQTAWIYSENVHQRATIEGLANEYNRALKALIAHCQSPEVGGYTPSDFPDADLNQEELDALLEEIE